jgi:hypothetical protein
MNELSEIKMYYLTYLAIYICNKIEKRVPLWVLVKRISRVLNLSYKEKGYLLAALYAVKKRGVSKKLREKADQVMSKRLEKEKIDEVLRSFR